MAAPVIEAGDITDSGTNSSTTANTPNTPAYVSGDLIIGFWGGDDDITADTITAPTNGVNGETLILTSTGSGGSSGQGPTSGVVAWIGDATVGATTQTWTRGQEEQWMGRYVKVLAGEFDATTPLAVVSGYSGQTSDSGTTFTTPSWAIGADDADGTVIVGMVTDIDPIGGTPAGWTLLKNTDYGAVAGAIAVRDAATTASETIASATYTFTSASASTVGVVVRPPASSNNSLRRRR